MTTKRKDRTSGERPLLPDEQQAQPARCGRQSAFLM